MKQVAGNSWTVYQSADEPALPFPPNSPFAALAHRCLPVKVCRKGNWVVTQGDPMESIYVIQEGSVMLTRMSASGKETILGFAGPGDFFGDVALLNGGVSPVNALAMRRSVLLVVRKSDFTALLEDPGASQALLRILAGRCRDAWEQVEVLGCYTLSEKLNSALLRLARENGTRTAEGIEISVSQSQLARMVGVTRESLNREMRRLRESSILKVNKAASRTSLVILDPHRLS